MIRRLYSTVGDCEFQEVRVGLQCKDKSRTIQSAKEETDINTIVKRFGLTGQLPVGLRVPTFEDFSNAPDDYQGALRVVKEAQAAFMQLPASIRVRFNNDPGAFVDFCSDNGNLDELRKMGLALDNSTGSAIINPKPVDSPPA